AERLRSQVLDFLVKGFLAILAKAIVSGLAGRNTEGDRRDRYRLRRRKQLVQPRRDWRRVEDIAMGRIITHAVGEHRPGPDDVTAIPLDIYVGDVLFRKGSACTSQPIGIPKDVMPAARWGFDIGIAA